MRQLFWKEWYELRFLPLGAALTVFVLLAGIKAYTHLYHEPYPTSDLLFPCLAVIWLLFAALAGAGTISQEIGTGTLQFLSSLPISRRTLWWVKAGAAFGMLLLSLLSSAAVWAILCALWCPTALHPVRIHMASQQDAFSLLLGIGMALALLLSVYAVALAVSPLFDRALSAFVASILVCIAVGALFVTVAFYNNVPRSDYPFFTLIVLSIPAFAMTSYQTFTRGESLRSARRFVVAGLTGGGWLVVISLVVIAGHWLWAW